MTPLRFLSCALRAGLSRAEALIMTPGEILDLFLYAQEYDDQQHGIRRERKRPGGLI